MRKIACLSMALICLFQGFGQGGDRLPWTGVWTSRTEVIHEISSPTSEAEGTHADVESEASRSRQIALSYPYRTFVSILPSNHHGRYYVHATNPRIVELNFLAEALEIPDPAGISIGILYLVSTDGHPYYLFQEVLEGGEVVIRVQLDQSNMTIESLTRIENLYEPNEIMSMSLNSHFESRELIPFRQWATWN